MRIDEPDAHAPIVTATIAARSGRDERVRRLLSTATTGYDIHAAWNMKLEVFIGQPPVFLQVTEGKRGPPALCINRRQELDLEGFGVHANADRFVFSARLLRNQFERQ